MSAPRHTLDQLRVLVAIVDAGTFAGAARALHRVPSAISYTVKSLEEALGLPLFDRQGQRATLNAAGRRLLEEAREALAQAQRLERVAESLRDGWESALSVVVDGVYPMEPVMRAVSRFTALGAPTRLRIHVEYQSGVVARFNADRADLMLMLEFDGTGSLTAIELPTLDMVLVAAAGHPLVAGPPVDRERLRAEVEVVVRDSAPAFGETPREAWFGSEHVVLLSDFQSKRIAIASGAGYGWLPSWLAAADLAAGRLLPVPFPEGNRWTYHPHLIHRRDLPLGRAGRAFLGFLQDEIASS